MRNLTMAMLLPLLLSPGACGRLPAPAQDGVLRIDGRSEQSFDASLRAIKDGMKGPEQSAFADAILKLHAPIVAEVARSSGGDMAAMQRSLRERLHGMSVAEVLAAAPK